MNTLTTIFRSDSLSSQRQLQIPLAVNFTTTREIRSSLSVSCCLLRLDPWLGKVRVSADADCRARTAAVERRRRCRRLTRPSLRAVSRLVRPPLRDSKCYFLQPTLRRNPPPPPIKFRRRSLLYCRSSNGPDALIAVTLIFYTYIYWEKRHINIPQSKKFKKNVALVCEEMLCVVLLKDKKKIN